MDDHHSHPDAPRRWPFTPAPRDCVRCGGRIHQMALRAMRLCHGCEAADARDYVRAGIRQLERLLAVHALRCPDGGCT
jgi:hypothetical protein